MTDETVTVPDHEVATTHLALEPGVTRILKVAPTRLRAVREVMERQLPVFGMRMKTGLEMRTVMQPGPALASRDFATRDVARADALGAWRWPRSTDNRDRRRRGENEPMEARFSVERSFFRTAGAALCNSAAMSAVVR